MGFMPTIGASPLGGGLSSTWPERQSCKRVGGESGQSHVKNCPLSRTAKRSVPTYFVELNGDMGESASVAVLDGESEIPEHDAVAGERVRSTCIDLMSQNRERSVVT